MSARFSIQKTAERLTESHFMGEVRDGCAWDSVLSAEEMAALARGLSPLQIRQRNLIAYWPLLAHATPRE